MIQAQELRIGNWVIINDKAIHGQAAKEPYNYQITGFDIYKMDESDEENGVFGIPLTYEILAANGFKMDAAPIVPEWHHDSGFWFFDDYGTGEYGMRLMDNDKCTLKMKFIHELQNAYKIITGEELPINLL